MLRCRMDAFAVEGQVDGAEATVVNRQAGQAAIGPGMKKGPDHPFRRPDRAPIACCPLGQAAARGWPRWRRSAQAGGVVGDGLDVRVGHLERDGAHHLGRVVGALAGAEGLQLGLGVVGELAGQARVLGRQAGTGGGRGRPRRPDAALVAARHRRWPSSMVPALFLADSGFSCWLAKWAASPRMSSSDEAATIAPMMPLTRSAGCRPGS